MNAEIWVYWLQVVLWLKNWTYSYFVGAIFLGEEIPGRLLRTWGRILVWMQQHSPSSLTTRGTFNSSSWQALVIPLAMMAQFTIPPKMFTRIASTCRKETKEEMSGDLFRFWLWFLHKHRQKFQTRAPIPLCQAGSHLWKVQSSPLHSENLSLSLLLLQCAAVINCLGLNWHGN